MGKVLDLIAEFSEMVIIHQKIPGQEVGRHQHTEHEFFLPLQGEISVTYEETTVKAGPGRMLYVPPKLDHSFTSSSQGSGERVIWLIEPKIWGKHIRTKFLPCSFPINSLAKELVFFLLIHRQAQGAQYFIAALVESLKESLETAQLEKSALFSDHLSGRVNDNRIAHAMALIEQELVGISLGDLAKKCGLSLRNFNRLFLKETGMSPKDYIILRRVEKAKQLMRDTQMTITDISLEVGYNSLSKFISTFKRIAGVLPSDFRSTNFVE